ncbi:hypothetical protein os1_32800 [Comamonadaceae bacterium OS-1]|nr:hypothetical protein os1_32800 [Comamonadaceae bacterium OS-1]
MADKRVKSRDPDVLSAARARLYAAAPTGEMSLGQSVRAMRKISGLTQAEYAAHRNVSLQALRQIERDQGNPTVDTLNKLAQIFGLRVGLVPLQAPHSEL